MAVFRRLIAGVEPVLWLGWNLLPLQNYLDHNWHNSQQSGLCKWRTFIDFLNNIDINVLTQAAYSLDLLPIIHLWDHLKHVILHSHPFPRIVKTVASAQEEWHNILQHLVQTLISSMIWKCVDVARHIILCDMILIFYPCLSFMSVTMLENKKFFLQLS